MGEIADMLIDEEMFGSGIERVYSKKTYELEIQRRNIYIANLINSMLDASLSRQAKKRRRVVLINDFCKAQGFIKPEGMSERDVKRKQRNFVYHRRDIFSKFLKNLL